MLAAGTGVSSKITSATFAPFWPIFFSGSPMLTPGRSRGTRKALTPRPPGSSPVRAMTVNRSARSALVMKRLVPDSRQTSPAFTAFVFTAPESLPTSGSVSAKLVTISPLAMRGSHSAFCSGVPAMTRPWLPIPTLVPNAERNAGVVRPSSIATRHSSLMVRPSPPYSSAIDRPNRPSSRISAITSSGIASAASTAASSGRSRSPTKRRTPSISASNVS